MICHALRNDGFARRGNREGFRRAGITGFYDKQRRCVNQDAFSVVERWDLAVECRRRLQFARKRPAASGMLLALARQIEPPDMPDMTPLLSRDDPAPFAVERPKGQSPFLLIADHAGRQIPRQLGMLGLESADLQRHIAWDIGIAGLASQLALHLDACLIRQNYSRSGHRLQPPADRPRLDRHPERTDADSRQCQADPRRSRAARQGCLSPVP
jgi:hypothetical protein